jgi:ankyrin repeat protein
VDGYSAVMWAGAHGSLNLVNMLLDAGASLNLANRQGETGGSLVKRAIAINLATISKVESKLKLKTTTAPASITATFY